jgi:hypothetical protein
MEDSMKIDLGTRNAGFILVLFLSHKRLGDSTLSPPFK